MSRLSRRKHSNSGQSLIELVLTLFAFFTILFLYVQVALSFGVANFFQYATFMAARAYLAGGSDPSAQKAAAQTTLSSLITVDGGPRFKGIVHPGDDGGDPPGSFIGAGPQVRLKDSSSRTTAWEQGVTYKFKARLNLLPILRSTTGQPNQIELESQSWLGREVTEKECEQYMNTDGPNLRGLKGPFLYDNGC